MMDRRFIALVAPRAIFVSGGAPITDPKYAPGDASQDPKGMFMATAAASPVWNPLGAKGLGITTFRFDALCLCNSQNGTQSGRGLAIFPAYRGDVEVSRGQLSCGLTVYDTFKRKAA